MNRCSGFIVDSSLLWCHPNPYVVSKRGWETPRCVPIRIFCGAGEATQRSYHVGITPARNVVGAALHPALWTLDDVGRRQTFVQGFGNLQALQGEHLLHALPQAARSRFILALQEPRQLLQSFLSFLGGLHLPGRPHQIACLTVLLFGQFVEHVADFVIAAALHRLCGSEHLLDRRTQRFGPIDDEQVLAVGRQDRDPAGESVSA